MHLNGRIKEANRELNKIDFLFVLRQQPEKVWDFITTKWDDEDNRDGINPHKKNFLKALV